MNMRPRNAALAAVFLGVGILIACFLPATALVVVISIVIIAVGCCCLKL